VPANAGAESPRTIAMVANDRRIRFPITRRQATPLT